jgi:hypothetical protein
MYKERSVDVDETGNGRSARTTVFLTDALNFHLDLYSLKTRRPKGQILRDALTQYLTTIGGFEQVDRIPASIQVEIARDQ